MKFGKRLEEKGENIFLIKRKLYDESANFHDEN